MKCFKIFLLIIMIPLFLVAENRSNLQNGFSIDIGGTFVHSETFFDMTNGEQQYGDFYYPGIDLGLTYQLSKRHSVTLFADLYLEPNGFYGVGFTYGNKSDKFAIGPLIAFVDDIYSPYLGLMLFVKNFYLKAGISREHLFDDTIEKYGVSYAHTNWISVGYSISMKRLNNRLFRQR